MTPDDETSPFLGITGWGKDIMDRIAAGMAETAIVMPSGKRIAEIIDRHFQREAARRAAAHADWFCSLPWYRQWWAMVRGG